MLLLTALVPCGLSGRSTAPVRLGIRRYILSNEEYYGMLNLAEGIPGTIVIMFLAPFIKKFGKAT